jgi:hypothetical protein
VRVYECGWSRDCVGGKNAGVDAQYRSVSRRTGVPPVLADGLPACRFIGGQAGRAVCPHRLEACSPIKKRKTNSIGGGRPRCPESESADVEAPLPHPPTALRALCLVTRHLWKVPASTLNPYLISGNNP